MVKNYKCPNCGAFIVFDGTSQKMHCPYCESELKMEEILDEQADSTVQEEATTEDESSPENAASEETVDFHAYQCKNCGAQLLTEEATAATFCSFCGSPALIESRLSGEKKPTRIIPFRITKEEAVEKYRSWTKKGVLTPKVFKTSATLEKISGVYVPYFLYDYSADVKLQASAKRVRTTIMGDTEYIYTDHFRLYRHMGIDFEKVPSDASKNMPDELMECLEPYRYEEMKTFELPYLSGFFAEKYTLNSDELKGRVEERINEYSDAMVRDTILGFTTYHVESEQIVKNCNTVEYVLLPVWMLNYRYKDQVYTFALNGQTGKMTANLPVSKGKAVGIFAGLMTVLSIISILIGGVL